LCLHGVQISMRPSIAKRRNSTTQKEVVAGSLDNHALLKSDIGKMRVGIGAQVRAKAFQVVLDFLAALVRPNTSIWYTILLSLVFLTTLSSTVQAAYISGWSNCLASSIQTNDVQLQWHPLAVWADFNTSLSAYDLNITVFGNVTGKQFQVPLPPPNDTYWTDPQATNGKIVDKNNQTGFESTLFANINVLDYTTFTSQPLRFCNTSVHGECPISPVFNG
jgi:hypothetical protein